MGAGRWPLTADRGPLAEDRCPGSRSGSLGTLGYQVVSPKFPRLRDRVLTRSVVVVPGAIPIGREHKTLDAFELNRNFKTTLVNSFLAKARRKLKTSVIEWPPDGRLDALGNGSHNDHMGRSRTVGARELKTRLGAYLRRVRAGETLIITDRGEPTAELRPIPAPRQDLDARLRQLEMEGLVICGNGRPLPLFKPRRSKGKSLADTVIDMREDRF
jgi:prevent-host-death family protein